jgi:cyclic pyranopterin phosphate synthase
MADDLTHLDATGHARMVDVGEKPVTAREALAQGRVSMTRNPQESTARRF